MTNATLVAILGCFGADPDGAPTTTADGHTLRVEKTATSVGVGPPAVAKHLSITFSVQPKDASKSFAYEIGQRFVARDAAGKEIPVGRVSSYVREPAFNLANYPPATFDDRIGPFGDPLTVTVPVLNANVASLASLEGDLFVSDVEVQEFTFRKDELNPNFVKKLGSAEAKLYLFDEWPNVVEIGFKFKLPLRSRASALAGENSSSREYFLLYATDAGRKSRLQVTGMSGGGIPGHDVPGDAFVRMHRDFGVAGLARPPDLLHLVHPIVEYPHRHVFRLKDVPVPAPAPQPRFGRPGGIALNRS